MQSPTGSWTSPSSWASDWSTPGAHCFGDDLIERWRTKAHEELRNEELPAVLEDVLAEAGQHNGRLVFVTLAWALDGVAHEWIGHADWFEALDNQIEARIDDLVYARAADLLSDRERFQEAARLVADEEEYAHVVSTPREVAVAEKLLERLAPELAEDERNRVAYMARKLYEREGYRERNEARWAERAYAELARGNSRAGAARVLGLTDKRLAAVLSRNPQPPARTLLEE